MLTRTNTFIARITRALSCSRRLSLLILACATWGLTACAPVQQGADQSKDFNVNLAELKDAKYKTLPVADGGLDAATRAALDAKVAEFMAEKDVDIAGCAIAITRNNQIAYLQAYGKADQAADRNFTIATPSAIGSISKTLTALGLMAMVEEGKLNLDQPLLDQMSLLPGVDVGWAGNATLRDVLAHKGGFTKDWPTWGAFNDGPSMNAAFPMIPYPSLQPLLVFQGYKSEAGNYVVEQLGTPAYSNVGYSLAGALLDYRSKLGDIPAHMRGYESYIWHRVGRGTSATEPTMGTAALATDFRQTDIKNLARGYATDGDAFDFSDATAYGWGWEGPSGGWTMTIGDLGRLMLILQSNAVVNKVTTIDAQMRDTANLQNYGEIFKGATLNGLGLEQALDRSWYGKGGDIAGYTADMKIWPSNGTTWGVAFVSNQEKAGKTLTGRLRNLLPITGGFGGVAGAGGQSSSTSNPLVELSRQYEPLARQVAQRYLAQAPTSEAAWQQAKKELVAYPNGTRLVSLLERGDLKGALQLLPSVMLPNGVPARR